jgi:transposase
MTCYVGLDVSLEMTSVCILDGDGTVLRETKIASDPDDLAAYLKGEGHAYDRIGLEAWSLANWIYGGLAEAGLPVICIEAGHAHRILSARPNKTDRNDARGIAEAMRVGLYRVVHVKGVESARVRAFLATRKLLQTKAIDLEVSIGGILRAFGVKVRKVSAKRFDSYIRTLLAATPPLAALIEPVLRARRTLREEFDQLDRQAAIMADADPICRRLMTAPGIGPLVALTYRCVIGDPARFKHSRTVGAHLGLTPRVAQSGKMDWRGRITKRGDGGLRKLLFLSAHVMLRPMTRPSRLRAWGLALVERRGAAKARVAVARRLAVILHRMWMDGTDFRPDLVAT